MSVWSTQVSCAAPSALCSPCQAAWQRKGTDRTLLSKHCRRHESCQFWTEFPASYQASSQQTAAQITAMCTAAFLCLTALPWMALVKAFPWAPGAAETITTTTTTNSQAETHYTSWNTSLCLHTTYLKTALMCDSKWNLFHWTSL